MPRCTPSINGVQVVDEFFAALGRRDADVPGMIALDIRAELERAAAA